MISVYCDGVDELEAPLSIRETRADGARVLVTGSEGFVGRHLRAALSRRGVTCVGVDCPGSGAEIEVDLADPGFDPRGVWDAAGQTTSSIYLAARISRTSSVDALARANLRLIAEAPVRLIEEAARRGACAHLVDCSTIKVFGPQRQDAIDAATHPRRPDPFCYGSAKALGERLLAIAAPRAGFTYAVVYPTYVYGPGQHRQNAIPLFLQAALGGEDPVVFGEGDSLRDDVFAPDLADVLAEAALQRATGSYFAAGEGPRTIFEIAEACCAAVAQLTGKTGPRPRRVASEPPKWWRNQRFDLTPTRTTFGYEPTPLVRGLVCEAAWLQAGATKESA